MTHNARLIRAFDSVQEAIHMVATAANALRETNDHDELSYSAIRLEGQATILLANIERALQTSPVPCSETLLTGVGPSERAPQPS